MCVVRHVLELPVLTLAGVTDRSNFLHILARQTALRASYQSINQPVNPFIFRDNTLHDYMIIIIITDT